MNHRITTQPPAAARNHHHRRRRRRADHVRHTTGRDEWCARSLEKRIAAAATAAPPSSPGLSAVGVAAAVATGAVCVVGSRAPVVVLRARQRLRVFCALLFLFCFYRAGAFRVERFTFIRVLCTRQADGTSS